MNGNIYFDERDPLEIELDMDRDEEICNFAFLGGEEVEIVDIYTMRDGKRVARVRDRDLEEFEVDYDMLE